MGPFMVEIVFCRVTRRGRKKGKGLNKAAMEASKNNMSGPQSFIPKDDVIKVTLDLSDNGPVFSAMDEMMMKMMEDEENERKKGGGKGKGGGGAAAKDSLKRLMKSGIPGVEKLFTGPGQAPGPGGKKQSKGFHKMNDSSKQKFMTAVFGEDGTTIDSGTAAALLAATCSGGDPTIANNIAQLLMPEIGAEIDQAMMGALMAACSLINAGANTEEVMKAMKAELRNSGMSEEEILLKTCLLMKCFNREDPGASMAEYNLASKQKNLALKNNGTSPKDFTLVVMVMKAIAACGSTPENVAKVIMIENQLSKKGAQSRFISDALKHLADYEKDREKVISALQAAFSEDKLNRDDVFLSVRMAQAIENENEPTWKDVKNMKELIAGCSVSSPEGIELNLARATKTGGLKSHDMTAALVAQKLMAHMQVDPKCLAQIINIMKNVSENGVPAVEIARVFNDGLMPPEMVEYLATQALEAVAQDITPVDVDAHVQLYDNLRLKSNIPLEVIEFVENKLVQVRCSLEDVADNMVSSQLARGEKESMVIRALCETLSKTGSSSEIVATTMMSALKRVLSETKSDCDIMKAIGNTMHEQGTEKENLQKAMVELLLNTLNEDPDSYDLRMEALKTIEQVLKDAGSFGAEVKEFMDTQVVHLLPPEPPDPKEQEEIRRKQEEEDAAAAAAAAAEEKAAEEAAAKESALVNGNGPLKNPNLDKLNGGSRAGSRRGSADVILGGSRRGSYYGDDITSKATVAMVVDDPESKDKINALLGDEEQDNGAGGNANIQIITVKDPVTGKPTQQAVQTRVDPKTGKSVQVPVQMPQQNGVGGGSAPQMVMVPDPVTGKPTQQLIQTVTDPKTGKTMQIPVSAMPAGGANQQIISVTDPATGKQVQQIVQTIVDPQTGKPTQVTMPLTQNGGMAGMGVPLQMGAVPLDQDGSISISTNGRAPKDVLESIFTAALEQGDIGPDLEATFKAMRSGKVTDEQVRSLMTVFETSGIVSSTGGVVRLRKVSDLRSSLEGVNSAFDRAIEDAHNKESPQISSENRRLMEDILKRSQDNQDQMSSRVTALLAGSSLTTTAGVRIDRRDTIDQIDYTAVGDDLSKLKESYKPRRRKAQSEMRAPTSLHQANSAELEDRCADAGIRVQRRSIKRMSLARLRKSSEFSGLRHPGANGGLPEDPEANGIAEIPEEDHRRIKGLRKAKVSMMVYSHGGFSRCFRIARRYQVEGPAIGVEYEEDTTNTVPKPAAAVENV